MNKKILLTIPLCAALLASCSLLPGSEKASSIIQSIVNPTSSTSDVDTTTGTTSTGGDTGTTTGTTTDTTTGSSTDTSTTSGGGGGQQEDTHGTLQNPLTVAEAIAIVSEETASSAASSQTVAISKDAYVKGVVANKPTESTQTQGTWRFIIKDKYSDKASIEFYFGTLASGVTLHEGDEVVILGRLADYSNHYKTEFIENDSVHSQVLSSTKKEYSITTQVGEHGTMSSVAATAYNDTKIEFTVTPNADYKVKYVKVNQAELEATEGVYSFWLVCDTLIEVEFEDADAVLSELVLTSASLFGSATTEYSYANADGDHKVSGITINTSNVASYASASYALQFKSGAGVLKNKTELPVTVQKIELKRGTKNLDKGTEKALTFYFGNAQGGTDEKLTMDTVANQQDGYVIQPTGGYKYFTIKNEASFAAYFDSIKITLGAPIVPDPEVVSVELDQTSVSMVAGSEGVTLVPTVTVKNGASQEVTWASDNEEVATVAAGAVTPLKKGTANITATSVADPTKSATCVVTVTEATVAVTSVSVSPTTLDLYVGGEATLTATVLPEDATDKSVTWSSGTPGVATVDQTGKVTAVGAGTATITATTTDGGKTATCAVAVGIEPGSTLETALNATDAYAIATGKSRDNVTKLYYFGGEIKEITGTQYGNLVITDGTTDLTVYGCSATGTYTEDGGKYTKFNNAKDWSTADMTKDLQVGDSLVIYGRLYEYNNVKEGDGIPQTTSIVPKVTSLTLDQTSLSMVLGQGTQTLTATCQTRGTATNAVTWASSAPEVVSVDNGVLTANAVGSATITVTSTFDSTKTATCDVAVTASTVAVTSVTMQETATLNDDSTLTLTPTVLPADATDPSLTWSSSAEGVATVANGVVTPVSVGTATITATSVSNTSLSASCTVTVVHNNSVKTAHEAGAALAKGAKGSDEYTYVGTVTAVSGTSFWVEDGGYGIYVYQYSVAGVEVGKKVSVTSKLQNYNGLIESYQPSAATVLGEGTAQTAKEVKSLADIAATNQNTTVKCEIKMPETLSTWAAYVDSSNKGSSPLITATLGSDSIKIKFDANGYTETNNSIYESSAGKYLILEGLVTTVYDTSSGSNKASNQLLVTGTTSMELANHPATDVSLSTDKDTIKINGVANLTAVVTPSNCTDGLTYEITEGSEYISLSENVVTGVAVGTAKIVAKAGSKTSLPVTITVEAGAINVESVALDKTTALIGTTETLQLTATIAPTDAENKNVSWSSSNLSAATVSDAGLVTAVAVGQTTITVTTEDGSKTATCVVTVKELATTEVDFQSTDYSIPTSASANESTLVQDEITYGYVQSKLLYSGQANQTVFFTKNSACFYNKTAMPGQIVRIKITTSNGAAGGAIYGITVGSSSISSYQSSPNESKNVVKSSSYTFECASYNGTYFNLSVSSANGQLYSIEVTYAK